jgi:hypothetical protein
LILSGKFIKLEKVIHDGSSVLLFRFELLEALTELEIRPKPK